MRRMSDNLHPQSIVYSAHDSLSQLIDQVLEPAGFFRSGISYVLLMTVILWSSIAGSMPLVVVGLSL